MIAIQLLEVYTPEIDIFVRYKVVDPADIEGFVSKHREEAPEDYIRNVMDFLVYNLHTDVTNSLRSMTKENAQRTLESIYNGCVMLNPGVDVETWLKISSYTQEKEERLRPKPTNKKVANQNKIATKTKTRSRSKISKAKFAGLEPHLKNSVIGQDEAVSVVTSALRRSIAGLGDEERPLGVFLFAGASGVGKSFLAKELHSYLFGEDQEMVRVDCGEFQHKHENQKLLGSPPGYVGYDEGGQLSEQMLKNPNTVLLLDEVEKAHPDMWDTFLRVFDEGMLTDGSGKKISFRDCIIIMTTNLGNKESLSEILNGSTGFNQRIEIDYAKAEIPKRSRIETNTKKQLNKSFRPEFLNRIDKLVVFNHLSLENMKDIAKLEMDKIELKLKKKGLSLDYGDRVLELVVEKGYNPVEGVRGLSRVRRDIIEDTLSKTLMSKTRWSRGTIITIGVDGSDFTVGSHRPEPEGRESAG